MTHIPFSICPKREGERMLVSLHVKNLALIDECEVSFQDGLNILTGETGAGKSVLMDSINLALGAKADNDLIRRGADSALIELVFSVDETIKNHLEQEDIEVDDGEDLLIIRRILQPQRSTLKVNGQSVTARQLKELSPLLLDMHGQHEHQSLLYATKQLECLDSYAGPAFKAQLDTYREIYEQYRSLRKRLNEEFAADVNVQKELDITEYEYKEIKEAALSEGEEEELELTCRKMDHMAKISERISEAQSLLSDDTQDGAQGQIQRALRSLLSVSSLDPEIEGLADTLSQAGDIMNDFLHELRAYADAAVFDEETYLYSTKRLDLIRHLEDKFGRTIRDVLAYGEECERKIEHLRSFEEEKEQLKEELSKTEKRLKEAAAVLHSERAKAALELKHNIEPLLLDMNFLKAEFSVAFIEKEEYTSCGNEEICFMISTNPGEEVKPLASVASGGEMSRIMLAFKSLMAEKDEIDTLIFDEIDTGISGKTAWKVARRMAELSKLHQVIAITHLPQIASMADIHFCISKSAETGVAITGITELDAEGRIAEMARLLGTDEVSTAGRENAMALLSEARSFKEGLLG